MRQKNLDLMVAVSIASINVFLAMVFQHIPLIGGIVALPLVFLLPGYTLTEVLFREQSSDAVHRLLFSLGLSLVIDILGGFILNILSVGLQAKSWAVLLGFLTVVFALLAALLRRRVRVLSNDIHSFRLRPHEYILFGLAIIVVAQALFYSAVGVIQQPHPGFTQFWILPPAQGGRSCTVRLGIHSFESTKVTYRITMTVNQKSVESWSSITLTPRQEWSRLVPIGPATADSVYIEAKIYRSDKPQSVYQQVHLTLPTAMASYCSQASGNLKVFSIVS